MTSQGAGASFASGETVPGWAACALTGNARIAPIEGGEAVVGFTDGDEARFRFVESGTAIRTVDVHALGAGRLHILADGAPIADVAAGSGPVQVDLAPGRHEITVQARDPQDLALLGIRFSA